MKDGKKIVLKSLHLKNLRKNLRELIDKSYHNEYKRIMDNVIQIERTRRNQKDDKVKAQMKIEIKNLNDQKNNLKFIYNKSILKCGSCNTLEGDRIYNKRFDQWFCPKCFEENYLHWPPSDWKPKYPLSKKQVIEFMTELDKVANRCQTNLNLSKEILTNMGVSKSDQKIFLDTLYHYGGHCDCEIMLNAYENVMADFDLNI